MVKASELGILADPSKFTEPLELGGRPKDVLISLLEMMLVIRKVEECIADLILEKKVNCPCHLAIGQEAVAVGVSDNLTAEDKIFGGHRSHSHFLALGGSVSGLLAEVLGRSTGCSGGMGGSMHLFQPEKGFVGSAPIVGGTVPVAVGAGLACQKDGKGNIAVCYFGDGTVEEGMVQESFNFASRFKLPVLFVCENNFYSSHLDIHLRQPSDRISRFAEANHISSQIVDGNDVVKTALATRELVESIRGGNGPGFLEAVTYRWRGHVGPDENIDVGLRRKKEDLLAWKKRDPIRRLKDGMLQANMITNSDYCSVEDSVEQKINDSLEESLAAPFPEESFLLSAVYKSEKDLS